MSLLELALYFAAWVGHSALWLVALNVLYSRPVHRSLLKNARLLTGVIVFGFPLAIAALWSGGVIGSRAQPAPLGLELYLALCLGMSLVVIPVVTIARQLRRPPRHLLDSHGEVIDFAQQFGHKPAGTGKHRRLAMLPFNQVFQVEFLERTLQLPGLPAAWNGLTILHLTDLHLTGTPDRRFYEAVLDRAMTPGVPDLIAVTGDLIDTATHHRWLLPLFSRLKWNEAALAILGNHDWWQQPERVRRRLTRAGMTVLGNSWRELRVRGEPLIAIGHEGPWFRPGPDLSDCPATGFRLCLSHTPDNIAWARAHGIQLMLSGHVHGGQIRLPMFGSLFVPSRYSRKYDCGVFDESPTLLYVGRGLGGKEPLRFNCRPEVARLTLRPG